MPPPIDPLETQRGQWMDALLAKFREHLSGIVASVNAKTAGYLQKSLSITNGVIDSSPGNLRILRTLNNYLEKQMDTAGFSTLVNVFVGEFPNQLHFIREELKQLDVILPGALPTVRFGVDEFASFQLSAASSIETVIEQAAGGAMNRVAFVSGGLKFTDLVESVSEKFQAAIPQTLTMADTAVNVFGRVAFAKAYDIIEAMRPDLDQKFKYFGPLDVKTREWCIHMLSLDQPLTREQIDELQPPGGFPPGSAWNVCGGWNCRHRYRAVYASTPAANAK